MSVLNLKIELAKLRSQYVSWKVNHPGQQSEELINKFLLLKAQFKAQRLSFKDRDLPLDNDAKLFQAQVILPAIPKTHRFGYPFAPVRSSGKIDGNAICLNDFLPYLKDFIIAAPTSWVVGGATEHDSTKGDLDMLHMLPDIEEISRIVDFRIFRMLPPNLAERIHSLWEDRGARSPFTAFYPLYRLRYERIPDAQVTQMAEQDILSPPSTRSGRVPPSLSDPSFSEIKLRTKGTEKREREANEAAKIDRITFGEFFLPQKPTRGYVPGQAQTLEFFLSLWKDEQFPVYSSRKADGLNSEFHLSKTGKVRMYTEDGTDETNSFPQTIEEAKKLAPDHDLIFLAEIEWWEGKQHFPREYTAGKVHRKLSDEAGIVVNVYDLVYFDSDIHNEPFEERWKRLKNLNFPQCSEVPSPKYKWNLIPNIKNADRSALAKETRRLRASPASEGNVAKQADAPYDLTGSRPMSWIKFHNSSQFHAVVLHPKETKTKGTFNLQYGLLAGNRKVDEKNLRVLDGQKIVYTGKTFATTDKVSRGGVITVETETLNVIFDIRTGTYDISAWSPRYLGRYNGQPDDLENAENRAIKDFCFQAKIIGLDGQIYYLPGKSGEEFRSK